VSTLPLAQRIRWNLLGFARQKPAFVARDDMILSRSRVLNWAAAGMPPWCVLPASACAPR
jgi:hypothetical protein